MLPQKGARAFAHGDRGHSVVHVAGVRGQGSLPLRHVVLGVPVVNIPAAVRRLDLHPRYRQRMLLVGDPELGRLEHLAGIDARSGTGAREAGSTADSDGLDRFVGPAELDRLVHLGARERRHGRRDGADDPVVQRVVVLGRLLLFAGGARPPVAVQGGRQALGALPGRQDGQQAVLAVHEVRQLRRQGEQRSLGHLEEALPRLGVVHKDPPLSSGVRHVVERLTVGLRERNAVHLDQFPRIQARAGLGAVGIRQHSHANRSVNPSSDPHELVGREDALPKPVAIRPARQGVVVRDITLALRKNAALAVVGVAVVCHRQHFADVPPGPVGQAPERAVRLRLRRPSRAHVVEVVAHLVHEVLHAQRQRLGLALQRVSGVVRRGGSLVEVPPAGQACRVAQHHREMRPASPRTGARCRSVSCVLGFGTLSRESRPLSYGGANAAGNVEANGSGARGDGKTVRTNREW
eukprot:scaffold97_cov261-Pinguiococcus_pyrenoidosus.AAC.6